MDAAEYEELGQGVRITDPLMQSVDFETKQKRRTNAERVIPKAQDLEARDLPANAQSGTVKHSGNLSASRERLKKAERAVAEAQKPVAKDLSAETQPNTVEPLGDVRPKRKRPAKAGDQVVRKAHELLTEGPPMQIASQPSVAAHSKDSKAETTGLPRRNDVKVKELSRICFHNLQFFRDMCTMGVDNDGAWRWPSGKSHDIGQHQQHVPESEAPSDNMRSDPILDFVSSPKRLAEALAAAAATKLSEDEFDAMQHFLQLQPNSVNQESLDKFTSAFEAFLASEVATSGQPSNRLARPSGPHNATLGLIMHTQTRRGQIGEFWDDESRAISLLARKGFHRDFAFGFDWHWRATTRTEQLGASKRACHATLWPQEQRRLHEDWSKTVLESLPLPILLICGKCPKKSYRKTLSNLARTLQLVISSSITIEIDLDFRPKGLRRIAVYMDHPSATDFSDFEISTRSPQQDASINLCAWLTGRSCDLRMFSSMDVGQWGIGVLDANKMKAYAFIQEEKDFDQLLDEELYPPIWWAWASSYLKKDPTTMLKEGNSVAQAVRIEIIRRKREKIAHIQEYWDGQSIVLNSFKRLTLYTDYNRTPLTVRFPTWAKEWITDSGNVVTLGFSEQGFTVRATKGQIVLSRSREVLSKGANGAGWIEQLEKEILRRVPNPV